MKRFTRHFPHYFSLVGILFAAAFGFYIFSYDRIFQFAIGVALAVAYVCWGVIHHAIHKDLELSIIVEYALVALLGLVVIFSLIFNS